MHFRLTQDLIDGRSSSGVLGEHFPEQLSKLVGVLSWDGLVLPLNNFERKCLKLQQRLTCSELASKGGFRAHIS